MGVESTRTRLQDMAITREEAAVHVQVGAVLLDAAAPFDALGEVTGSARYAEHAGLDSLWAGDHLLLGDSPLLDSTMILAAAAAVTRTIAIGSAVFLPSLRSLAWAGRQVATLAHLAAGRLELGVGAGAGPEEEFRAAGQRRSDRGRRTDEFLDALPRLLAGGPVTVGSGDDAVTVRLQPPTPMPTVWIGGSSAAALERTIRFGDGWLGTLLTPAEFSRTRDRLRELADAAGRPLPRLGLVTHAAITPPGHRPLRETALTVLRRSYGLPQEQAEQLAVAGSPAHVAHHLAEYTARGAEHLVVINDLTPWRQACDLLKVTKDELAGL